MVPLFLCPDLVKAMDKETLLLLEWQLATKTLLGCWFEAMELCDPNPTRCLEWRRLWVELE